MKNTSSPNIQIISYLTLRTLIGLLGFILPVFLIIGEFFVSGNFYVYPSLSRYYYTSMRDIFTGVLFVIGFFLLSYKGYSKIDNITGNLGFVFAVGVALCPTGSQNQIIHILHYCFAGLLFSVFIFFSLYLFRKGKDQTDLSSGKKRRNAAYFVCGIIMIVCLVVIAISLITLSETRLESTKIVLIFETIALWAFGISWLTKGKLIKEMVFGDL